MATNTQIPEIDPDAQTLARCVWSYYMDGKTQAQIAKELNTSRASIGRMLEKSRASGIVNISISPTFLGSLQLAAKVKEKFGLRNAVVLPSGSNREEKYLPTTLGTGAVQVLREYLAPGSRLGLGWGQTVSATFSILSPEMLEEVSIVSLTGGVNSYLETILRLSGRHSKCEDSFIPTPILVSHESLAQLLLAEEGVQTVIKAAENSQVALIGIGAVSEDATLSRIGYTSPADLQTLRQAGAVGDLLGVFYTAEGVALDCPLHRRRIGIGIQALQKIPTVIAVAGGQKKTQAIIGALKGGYIDVLVTDEASATLIMEAP